MNRALPPLARFPACLALTLVLVTASRGAAQTTIVLQPSTADTAGGTVLQIPNSQGYRPGTTATVNGVPAEVVFTDRPWIVAPPAASPGPATVLITAMTTSTQINLIATIEYIGLPQIGLETPITRVSLGSLGEQSLSIGVNGAGNHSSASSGDGRYVTFVSDTPFPEVGIGGTVAVFRKDLLSGALRRVASCVDVCNRPSISLDGSRIATFRNAGVFVFEEPFTGPPLRVDIDSGGNPPTSGAPSAAMLSGNGRVVVFATAANLDGDPADAAGTSDLFVHDLDLGFNTRWTTSAAITFGNVSISADGRLIAFVTASSLAAEDTNGFRDVYLLDRSTGEVRLLTPGANGHATRVGISSDGSTVGFDSLASNLVGDDTNQVADVFIVDVATWAITRVSARPAGGSETTAASLGTLSGNGQRIAMFAPSPGLGSTFLPANVTGVYVHDRPSGTTWLVNASSDGVVGGPTFSVFGTNVPSPAMVPDGRAVTFSSHAPNLVADDTNAMIDAFRKELPPDTPAGSDVPAVPVDPATGETPVSLTFTNITVPGDTSVTYTETAPPLPSGFQAGSRYVDITTTAVFSGAITVCVEYDPAATADPSALRLLHYQGGAWVDITTGSDAEAGVVCGATSSLSPFVLAIPVAPAFTARSLLDEGRVFKAGSTIPIRVQVLDGSGANVSAAALPLVATGVRQVSSQTDWATPEDPGQSNPDLNFQFTTVEGEPGYRFNLKTTGFAAGTYELRFTVGAGGPALAVAFQVR